ncbi:MAG TPA: hypothetical protein VGO93_19080, partial [Candidatus Xenobia bacterium]
MVMPLTLVHPLPSPPDFQGRAEALETLERTVGHAKVVVLCGAGGTGKSALVGRWLAGSERDGLVWSFNQQAEPERYLQALAEMLAERPSEARGLGRVEEVLEGLANRPGLVLVLDGLERVQDDEGRLTEPALELLLERLPSNGVTAVVTTRLPLQLAVSAEELLLGGFERSISVEVLRGRGVTAPDNELDAVAARAGDHPLTLSLTAGVIQAFLGGEAARFLEHSQGWVVRPGVTSISHVLASLLERLTAPQRFLVSVVGTSVGPVDRGMLQDLALDDSSLVSDLETLRAVGLLEQGPLGWGAHAVVRDHVSVMEDPSNVHVMLADYLTAHPKAHATRPEHVDKLEAMILHLVAAGRVDEAVELYRRRLHEHICLDWGRYEACQRIVTRLLEALAPRHEMTAMLLNDLGVALDFLGDTLRAARCYLGALKRRIRQQRSGDARSVLLNIAENALQRGRLPLAEKAATIARRWTVRHGNPAQEPEAMMYLWYVRQLRGRAAVLPAYFYEACPAGSLPLMLADIWIRQGRGQSALRLTLANGVKGDLKWWTALRQAQSQANGAQVEAILPNLRRLGNLPLLAEAYLTAGSLSRGDAALGYLRKALKLARRHGFGLIIIDARRMMGDLNKDVAEIEVSLHMAEAPQVDYAWGQDLARDRLGLPMMHERVLWPQVPLYHWPSPVQIDEASQNHHWPEPATTLPPSWALSMRAEVAWGPGLPPLLLHCQPDWLPTFPLSGQDLADWLAVQARACSSYPHDLNALYHLAVGLCLAPLDKTALYVADRLPRDINPLLTSCVRLAARPDAESALAVTRALDVKPGAHPLSATAWYNLGAWHEVNGDYRKAVRCYRASAEIDCIPQNPACQPADPPPPEVCKVDLKALIHSIDQWCRVAKEEYPLSPESLVGIWWDQDPTCELSGEPLMYRVLQNRARCLIGCRRHRRFYDSTLGWLPRPRRASDAGWYHTLSGPDLAHFLYER